MAENIYALELAGLKIRYRFLFPDTPGLFSRYLISSACCPPDLETKPADLERWAGAPDGDQLHARAEYRTMVLILSQYLLSFDRCVCHAAAVRWKGWVWLFSAPSGMGKTTLYRNWKQRYGSETELVSGDMPLLECRKDGTVWVYSSPWDGKENYRGYGSGKLGGILLLQKGETNRMEKLPVHKSILRVFSMLLVSPQSKEAALKTANVAERILEAVPVWNFENTGNEKAAETSHDFLEKYLNEEQ